MVSSSPTAPDSSTMSSFAVDPAAADSSLGANGVPTELAGHDGGHGGEHSGNGTSGDVDTDDGARKKKGTKRRKVNHACLYCRRSHMTCDEGRPCQRWYESARSPPLSPSLPHSHPFSPRSAPPFRTRDLTSVGFCIFGHVPAAGAGGVQHQAGDRAPVPRRAAHGDEGEASGGRERGRGRESADRRRAGLTRQVPPFPPLSLRGAALTSSAAGRRGAARTGGQYAGGQMPMNQTWPGGAGMGMAQGAWLYPPETLSNEFSVLS